MKTLNEKTLKTKARRQFLRVLREHERRYRALFHSLNHGFALFEAVFDESGEARDCVVIEVNSAFERLTGHEWHEAVGRTLLQLRPEIEPGLIEELCRVALTGESAHFERYTALLNRCFEVHAFSPEPGQVACLFFDTTARKNAEEALRESQDRLRLVIDSAGLGVFDVELKPGRVTCSEVARRHLGVPPDEPLNASFFLRRVCPEWLQNAKEAVQSGRRAENGRFAWERRFTTTAGLRRISMWGRVLLDQEGCPKRIVGVTCELQARSPAARISHFELEPFCRRLFEGFASES